MTVKDYISKELKNLAIKNEKYIEEIKNNLKENTKKENKL